MLGCIGHIVFVALHVLAILFGFVGLFFTVPMHLIFAAVMVNQKT